MQVTDTERLDFMLSKFRKVVVELAGFGSTGRYFDVYVEEGYMADHEYPHVQVFAADKQFHELENATEIKRQAIDRAIIEYKEKSNEKGN